MTDCIEWPLRKNSNGYGIVWRVSEQRDCLVHRIIYCEANGLSLETIEGLVVRHKCDNPPCVNPDHLELGTQADNMADRGNRGRTQHGVKHYKAKLTEQQVWEIREIYQPYDEGECGAKALSKRYGVSKTQILRIANHTDWSHIQ